MEREKSLKIFSKGVPARGWKSFAEFISTDISKYKRQQTALLSLFRLHCLYSDKGLTDSVAPLPNTFSEGICSRTTFEVYRIKRSILHGEPVNISEGIPFILTEYLNQVFIMAMIYGRVSIVESFLSNKLLNPNSSMFRSQNWPSYFLLACCCDPSIFRLFQRLWINYNISWNGLGPAILCTISKNRLDKARDMDFISYNQLVHLNRFRGVALIHSIENLPVFPLDLACIMGDVAQIKYILENTPETGVLSRISFIVRCEEHIILVLSRYGFSKKQSFNGNTPLHYSCYKGDFCTLSMQLYLGFPICANRAGYYPNEVGSTKTKEKTSIFFNLCASTPVETTYSRSPIRLFSPEAFKKNMTRWMHVLNFKESEFDKYIGIFKYLDFNEEHRIYKKSRFSIITVFGLSKTSSTVEKIASRLAMLPVTMPEFTDRERTTLYSTHFVNGRDRI